MNLPLRGICLTLLPFLMMTNTSGTLRGESGGMPAGVFENLGAQMQAITYQASTFTQERGRQLLCTLVRSQPAAKFCVIDASTGEMLGMFDLPGANGGWAMTTASDGSVYIGTESQGKLFRYVPGESSIHDLGRVFPEESFIWDLTAGRDGAIYGGTYPGCRVFKYTPAAGVEDIAGGAAAPGESYARSVAFSPDDKVFVGVGTRFPHLIEIDLKTRAKREMLTTELKPSETVYSLSVTGGKVFAMISPIQQMVVMDPVSGAIQHRFKKSGLYQLTSPASPLDGRVYFTSGTHLVSLDPDHLEKDLTQVTRLTGALAYAWINATGDRAASELAVFTDQGTIVKVHPATGRIVTVAVKVPPQPLVLQSLLSGPDGRIWMSSYLSGGNAAFDPRTRRTTQYRGLGQSEKMTSHETRIFFGIYPNGRLYAFDTSKDWDVGKQNPRLLTRMAGQSRPVSLLVLPEQRKLLSGNIPEYGMLGGALGIYDLDTGESTLMPNFIERQSVSSLARAGDLVVGGTTVHGGLGIAAVEESAKLFLFDPKSGQKVFETVPVNGAPIVSGLTAGPDKKIWGFAGGSLFIFDPVSRKMEFCERRFSGEYSGRAVWQEAALMLHPNGSFYGLFDGRFFRLDPRTKETVVLKEWRETRHTRPLALQPDGDVYFSIGTELIRYSP